MTKYQYQIIRYMHDQFSGEFANVGIVLYAAEKQFLGCKVVNRYSRLSEFFGAINGNFLIASLRQFEKSIRNVEKSFASDRSLNGARSLVEITCKILPPDDSALQLSEVVSGIDVDVSVTLEDLYDRLIERYNNDGSASKHTDYEAWTKVYKSHFEKYGLNRHLKRHVVKTQKDEISFDKAWKNGAWNCYQTLAFNLQSADSIKSKVYKWSGIIKELETSKENVKVFLLTTSPEHHHELEPFIKETLQYKDEHLTVEVIEEKKAEQFATRVRNDMQQSSLPLDFPHEGNEGFPF